MLRILSPALPLLLGLALLAGCASVPELQPPAIALNKVELLEVGFSRQRFALELQVANPNAIPLPVRSISYGLTLGGTEVGSGRSTDRFRIPARGDSTVTLELDIDTVRLLGQLNDWMRRPPTELTYLLDGQIELEAFPRPLHFTRDGRVPLQIDPSAFRL